MFYFLDKIYPYSRFKNVDLKNLHFNFNRVKKIF